jgi:hypothetical protein
MSKVERQGREKSRESLFLEGYVFSFQELLLSLQSSLIQFSRAHDGIKRPCFEVAGVRWPPVVHHRVIPPVGPLLTTTLLANLTIRRLVVTHVSGNPLDKWSNIMGMCNCV